MSDLEDFQREHGREWVQITQHPAFGAAMQYLNLAKINSIATLTDADIETNGKLVLADLRGHLNHENDLMRLSAIKEFKFGDPIRETYPDPMVELAEQIASEGRDEKNHSPQPPKSVRKKKP